MTPEESSRLIQTAGGDTKFAELLGITESKGYKQRVNNWKRRGIPADVVLEHLQTIQKLQRRASAP